jgi:hypothetical protein
MSRVFYNPEMQHLHRALKGMKNRASEPVPDDDLAAELAAGIPASAAFVPQPIARDHQFHIRQSPVFYRAKIALVFRASAERSANHHAIVDAISPRKSQSNSSLDC